MLNRGDYWQCGFVIPKGTLDEIRGARARRPSATASSQLAPFWPTASAELGRLGRREAADGAGGPAARWYRPGLLCIGDAAHAMSPVGGVGINLAIQDAVAAANLLAGPLREGTADARRTSSACSGAASGRRA